MIITVICPLCGKTIQIEENNDANICICCNRAFITKNCQRIDNNNSDANAAVVNTNVNSEAERLYNNINGLLDRSHTADDIYLSKNIEEFKTKFPLDDRILLINYRLIFNKLLNTQSCDLVTLLNNLYSLKKYNQNVYNEKYQELYEYIKNISNEDYDDSMIDLKLGLRKVKYNEVLENAANYKKELEKYNKRYSEYETAKRAYDNADRKYSFDLNFWLNSGDTLSVPAPKKPAILDGPAPYEPYKPSNPNHIFFSILASSLNIAEKPRFGIDKKYLLKLYNFVDSNLEELIDESGSLQKFYAGIVKFFDKDVQDEINEKIKQKHIKQIMFQITKYFNEYQYYLNHKIKRAYEYINKPYYIEKKLLYVDHEKIKFTKGLFSVKYSENTSEFDVQKAAKIAFEKTNFEI